VSKVFLREIVTGVAAVLIVTGSVRSSEPAANSPVATKKPKVVLVELFTSEGCSSCPPADALLRELNGAQTAAGQLIVGISEHVTYWNSLGWSDPFSSSIYTERQNAYGKIFNLDSVYTPQMVINGEEQTVGSDRAGVVRAIRNEEDKPQPISVRIISMNVTANSLTINFSAVGTGKLQDADIIACIVDDADQSSVLRGENSGRTLTHVGVARLLERIAKLRPVSQQTVQIPLPPSFRTSQKHHVILFAQTTVNGEVLGADTQAL